MIDASMVLSGLGTLAVIVNIIVELSKAFIPKKVPTQLVTIIVSLIVCLITVFLFCEAGIKTIMIGILMTPIVAFTSMNGFDTVNELWKRFQVNKEEKEDE